MAAWQRCMARSETTLASKMSVFGHEQESVEVVVRDLMLRSSKAVYINVWPNRRRRKERDYAEAATRSRTPECQGGVQDPQTGWKPPCSRRLDRESPHHLVELARVAHRQDR